MEAKEKAQKLIQKYLVLFYDLETDARDDLKMAKQCALIAVDEIWKAIDENFAVDSNYPALSERKWNRLNDFYKEVKTELEKL